MKQIKKLNSPNYALIAGLLLTGAGVFTLILKRRKTIKKKSSSLDSRVLPSGPFRCQRSGYPLQFGVCDPRVKILQRYLKKLGAPLGSYGPKKDGVDGRFGKLTHYQAKRLLGKVSFTEQDMMQIENKL